MLPSLWVVKFNSERRNLVQDTLYIVLKSTNFGILPLDNPPPGFFKNQCKIISNLKVICAKSCGHIEALRTLKRTKTNSQQHHS